MGGARALGALGGAACVRLALGCAWHRTSGCAQRMGGVGWLGSPAMAFYLSAGVASMRNAVPHTALPVPARIWAAFVHLCLGPPPARCAGRWALGLAEGTACGRRICSHGVRTAGLGVEGCMRFGVERASHALTALWRGADKLVALGCGSLHQACTASKYCIYSQYNYMGAAPNYRSKAMPTQSAESVMRTYNILYTRVL